MAKNKFRNNKLLKQSDNPLQIGAIGFSTF